LDTLFFDLDEPFASSFKFLSLASFLSSTLFSSYFLSSAFFLPLFNGGSFPSFGLGPLLRCFFCSLTSASSAEGSGGDGFLTGLLDP